MIFGGFVVFEVFDFLCPFFNFPPQVVCEVNFKSINNFKEVLEVPRRNVRSLLEIKFGIFVYFVYCHQVFQMCTYTK